MSTKLDELRSDIDEFNALLQQATRRKTKDVLTLEMRRLETELSKITDEIKCEATKQGNTPSGVSQKCYEVKLNNYGWDQTNTAVKLYITLKNVHQLPKEAVVCNFTKKSLDLRIIGLENKNYNLSINNLCEEIDPDKSHAKVKTDMVVISLAKKVAKEWSHITGVEKRINEGKKSSFPEVTEDSDPGAVMMNLMRTMYQEGDDEMKRTIAKAWTESQEKKAAAGTLDFP